MSKYFSQILLGSLLTSCTLTEPKMGYTAEKSCAFIPVPQQTVCPIQRESVLAVQQLQTALDPKGNLETPTGVMIYVVASPGLTSEWLGHTIECYQARISEDKAIQAQDSCPLAEPGTTYSVTSTRNGYAVTIRTERGEAAKHIFDVSQRLVSSK
jgi:hypothetical protein